MILIKFISENNKINKNTNNNYDNLVNLQTYIGPKFDGTKGKTS